MSLSLMATISEHPSCPYSASISHTEAKLMAVAHKYQTQKIFGFDNLLP